MLTTLLATLLASPLLGQESPSLELIVPESAGGLYGSLIAADRDHTGRTWLIVSGQLPVLFSEDGEFLGRVGTEGQGPGEFRRVNEIAPIAGDSVAIVDVGNSRVSIWSSTTQMNRGISLPFPFRSMVVEEWPHSVWVSGSRARRGPSSLIYRLDLSGTQAQVVDSLPLRHDGSGPMGGWVAAQRELEITGDTLWVMAPHAPSIQAWTTQGSLESTTAFVIAWLGDPLAQEAGGGPRPIPKSLDAVWFDQTERRFTVFGRTGDSDRFDAIIQEFIDQGIAEVPASEFPSDAELHWSRRVDVDPSGEVISDVRVDGLVIDVTHDGYAVRVVADQLGLLTVFLDPLS